jgi:hypothetical protein
MNAPSNSQPTLYRLWFVLPSEHSYPLAFCFADPAPRQVAGEAQPLTAPPTSGVINSKDGLEVLVLPSAYEDDSRWREGARDWLALPDQPEVLSAQWGAIQVSWHPGRAVIVAPPAEASATLEAVVDFAYYENELRRLEQEIAAGWSAVEGDAPLVYDIAKSRLAGDKEIGQRVQQVLQRRMRHARIEPHLRRPPASFSQQARELGNALRGAAQCEERMETVDGQIEVQEYIYEMASQRMGEFRHARMSSILETIIIALLAAEVILMIIAQLTPD